MVTIELGARTHRINHRWQVLTKGVSNKVSAKNACSEVENKSEGAQVKIYAKL